jgi:hypothetical protein
MTASREFLASFSVSTIEWHMSHQTKKELTMKRNAFLITAALFCFASFAMAAEQKKQSAPRSQQAEQQTEMARNDADAHVDSNSSNKNDCGPKGEKSAPKHMQDDPEGDPQASQNQVEYGGGG